MVGKCYPQTIGQVEKLYRDQQLAHLRPGPDVKDRGVKPEKLGGKTG